jgi:hypothetical protein
MSQKGLKVNNEGNWISYDISDSNDKGWNDSIINAKLEKNVDKGAKRAIFTSDTVTNEIETDPYKGAYDDYIPWWLQKGNGANGGKDIDDTGGTKTTKTLSPYEEVFGKPSLGAQTYNLTGKSIQELYAERELPGLTTGEHLKKGLILGTGSIISEKWKDKSLEAEIKRREESNLKLHGTKTPTQLEVLGADDRDTGAKPGGQTPLSEVTIGGKSATDIGARRGKGGTIITKDKPYEGPTGADAEEGGGGTKASYSGEVSQVGTGRQDREGGGNGGNGGNGGGCVVATHAVNAGVFDLSTKRQAIRWCVKNLHRTWWGEAVRKGYRYYGQKAIDQGTVKNHYKEFKNYLAFATGRKRNLKNAWTFLYRTVQFFIKGITI